MDKAYIISETRRPAKAKAMPFAVPSPKVALQRGFMEPSDFIMVAQRLVQALEAQGLTPGQIQRVFNEGIKQCRVFAYNSRGPKLDCQRWKPVLREGFEQYVVSDWGFVRHKKKSKCLQPAAEHSYARASMSAPDRPGAKAHMIHELVYESFELCETLDSFCVDEEREIINHKDGDKWNPALDNLELTTLGENMLHAYRNKLRVSTKHDPS